MTQTIARTQGSSSGRSEFEVLLQELEAIAESGNSEQMTLPPAAYRSPELFELEWRRLFRPSWIMAGRLDQIAKPGDYMSVDVGPEHLVLTRDLDGEVHVMSRMCRHRWMRICEGSGNVKSIECPYHAWRFGLDGRLQGAPDMAGAPSFDRSQLSLFRIRHEVWQGFIFVNLSGDADPLAPKLAGIEQEIKEYRLGDWVTVWSKDYGIVDWDWKVMQDNGDCYHHIGLHKTTLYDMWPIKLIWDKPNNGEYTLTGCGTAADQLVDAPDGRKVMPHTLTPAEGLTQFQLENLFLIYIHPNYFIAPTPGETYVARVFPVGAGKVHFITDVLAPPNALKDPEVERKIEEAGSFLDAINNEDFRACSTVQQEIASGLAVRGPLSNRELMVAQFATWYSRRITGVGL